MAEHYAQTPNWGPDPRAWNAAARRMASLGVLAGAGVLVLLGIVFYTLLPAQAGWFLVLAIVLLVLLLAFEAAVVATGVAREEDLGPEWLRSPPASSAAAAGAARAPPAEPEPGAPEGTEVDLKCPECQNLFTVEDDGTRPLEIACPHCGAHGHVDLPPLEDHAHEPAPEAGAAGAGATLADEPLDENPVISLKCPACATQFEVEDDGTRPLRATCPGCGKGGRLK